ncbi:PREDICTED: uncharacterized protein LOC108781410 [Cyphomyrmex costatus]|uniref:Transcriptional regulator ATRX n=1 Tax=Cyphomyrmex costatus TaxID=456900 RepID=A0A151I863_9HYME|nr:PREDICTED: uncharacterized protein LOC108781410 [Cyphomyrmex costatus]KYM94334.1 Transcriptional regulator ATRX [Cyphomyrmex costatus]
MDISSMLEVQVKEETDVKENVTPENDQASSATSVALTPFSQEESNYHKLMFGNDIATVRFRRIHCTACDIHIGSAPSQVYNMFEHPVLRTLLCTNCREFYGDGCFEQGDDATDMFCRWCANGGNLYCCSYCSNTFCYKCIRRNFSSLVRKKIEADEKWKCFVCHPSDLYNARAVCWALLQHIQTVRRILAQDKKMSREEIEEKMNLDESTCCPRRSKRKRRRLDSNSDEDVTYVPKVNGMSGYIKRKPLKRYKTMKENGIVTQATQFTNRMLVPIRPRPTSFLTGQSFNAESSESVGNKNSTASENIVVSSPNVINSNTSLPSRFDPNRLQQQSPLYHTSFMSASGSAAYIQTPLPMNRIILPPQPQPQSQLTYQPQRNNSYQPSQSLQSSPNTMVSIPNPMDKNSRPLFILPQQKNLGITLTPNIIDLDSDSDDEPSVIEQQNNFTIDKDNNTDTDKIVPVALTWEKNDDDVREDQPLRVICATVKKNISFSEMMLPHSQDLDKLLNNAKKKMYNFFDLNNAIENIEIKAQQKVKHFYNNMRDTVLQLVDINDKVVRQYIEWRRSQKTEIGTETSFSINENALESSRENVDIPLDMICVNDSDTESDYEIQKYQPIGITKPSDLVKDNNIIKDLLFCKKNVEHRGSGDDSVHLSVDKAIQVYDIVSRDYEKCIGYSVLTRTAYDSKMDNSVSDLPLTSDENFGKYEEQFIYYLQHIEDNGIETEDSKGLIDSEETSLQELQTDLSFTSHLIQNIDLPILSTDQLKNSQLEESIDSSVCAVSSSQLKNCQQEKNNDLSVVPNEQLQNCQQEKNIDLPIVSVENEQSKNYRQEKHLSNNIDSETKDDKSDTLDKNDEEIVSNFDIKIQEVNMKLNDNSQLTELQKIHSDIIEDIISNNGANSNKNDILNIQAASTESEEDCTIIDD